MYLLLREIGKKQVFGQQNVRKSAKIVVVLKMITRVAAKKKKYATVS